MQNPSYGHISEGLLNLAIASTLLMESTRNGYEFLGALKRIWCDIHVSDSLKNLRLKLGNNIHGFIVKDSKIWLFVVFWHPYLNAYINPGKYMIISIQRVMWIECVQGVTWDNLFLVLAWPDPSLYNHIEKLKRNFLYFEFEASNGISLIIFRDSSVKFLQKSDKN